MKTKRFILSLRFFLVEAECLLFFDGSYLLFEVVVLFFELDILSNGVFDYFVPFMFAVSEALFERGYLLFHCGMLAEDVFEFFNGNRGLLGVTLDTHLFYLDDGK